MTGTKRAPPRRLPQAPTRDVHRVARGFSVTDPVTLPLRRHP